MSVSEEEREREALLSQVQRYPQLLTAEQWAELQTLARAGDLERQLELLRTAVGPAPAGSRPGASAADQRDAFVLELLDRLADAERRAGAAEEQVRQLSREIRRLTGEE
jgi:hypothetical protein